MATASSNVQVSNASAHAGSAGRTEGDVATMMDDWDDDDEEDVPAEPIVENSKMVESEPQPLAEHVQNKTTKEPPQELQGNDENVQPNITSTSAPTQTKQVEPSPVKALGEIANSSNVAPESLTKITNKPAPTRDSSINGALPTVVPDESAAGGTTESAEPVAVVGAQPPAAAGEEQEPDAMGEKERSAAVAVPPIQTKTIKTGADKQQDAPPTPTSAPPTPREPPTLSDLQNVDLKRQRQLLLGRGEGNLGGIQAAGLEPSGDFCVTIGKEYTDLIMWQLGSGTEVGAQVGTPLAVDEQCGRVNSVVFAPDGRRMFVGCQDGTVRFWKRHDTEQERARKVDRIAAKAEAAEKRRMEEEEQQRRLEEEERHRLEEEERKRWEEEERKRREAEESKRQEEAKRREEAAEVEAEATRVAVADPGSGAEMSEFEKMKLMMLGAADEYQQLKGEYEEEFGEQWSPTHASAKPKRFTFDAETPAESSDTVAPENVESSGTVAENSAGTSDPAPIESSIPSSPKQESIGAEGGAVVLDKSAEDGATSPGNAAASTAEPVQTSPVRPAVPVMEWRPNGMFEGHKKPVRECAVQWDGKRVMTASEDQTLKYWSVKKQNCLSTLRGHKGEVLTCDMYTATKNDSDGEEQSQNTTLAVSGATDGHVRFWKMDLDFKPKSKEDPGGRGWKCEWCFDSVHSSPVSMVRFANNGEPGLLPRLASTAWDGTTALLCVETMCALVSVTMPSRLRSIAPAPSGQDFLAVAIDGTCSLWNYNKQSQQSQLLSAGNMQGAGVNGMWHKTGKLLCVGDCGWSLWNAIDAKPEVACLPCSDGGEDAAVTHLSMSPAPESSLLAAASGDGSVRVFALTKKAFDDNYLHNNIPEGDVQLVKGLAYSPLLMKWKCCDDGEVLYVRFTPSMKALVACCDDGNVRIYNWDNPAAPPVTLEAHSDAVVSCDFNKDGSRMCTVSWDGTCKLWDWDEGECICTCDGHDGWVRACALGRFLITGDDSGTVRVFAVGSAEPMKIIQVHDGAITAMSYNEDQTNVVTCGDDGTVHVLDLGTGQTVCRMEGHEDAVNGVAYTKDGYGIVSVSSDRTLRFWSATNGAELVKFGCGEDESMTIAVAPDNRWTTATSGKDGKVRIWSIDYESYY